LTYPNEDFVRLEFKSFPRWTHSKLLITKKMEFWVRKLWEKI